MRSAFLGLVLAACCAAVAAAAQKPPPLGTANRSPVALGKPPPLPPDADSGILASSGSGFVAAPARVLTNDHVVEGCQRLVARNAAGETAPAQVLATDTLRDLAVLTVRDGFAPPVVFRDGPVVERGESVVTYGFPLSGLLSSGPTLTTGNVSALSGLRDDPREFEISAPVQTGSSGGPLLDMSGNVIGVVVAKLNAARVAEMTDGDIPQNVNFAVKSTEVLAFLRAQGIRPRTVASGALTRSAAEVGEVANVSTVFLRCYK